MPVMETCLPQKASSVLS